MAGVINIITKKSGKKPLNFNVDLSAGSYDTYKGAVSLSGTNGNGQTYFISYNKIKSNGFSSAYDSTGKNNFDKDGFNQDVFHLNYGFNPLKKHLFMYLENIIITMQTLMRALSRMIKIIPIIMIILLRELSIDYKVKQWIYKIAVQLQSFQ